MSFTEPNVSFRLDWLASMTLLFVFSFPVLGLQIGSTVFYSYIQLGISAQVIRLARQTTCRANSQFPVDFFFFGGKIYISKFIILAIFETCILALCSIFTVLGSCHP